MNPNLTAPARRAAVEIPPPPEDFDDEFVKSDVEPEVPATASAPQPAAQEPSGGLAAAIARARTIQQEPLKTARQQAQSGKINRV
jgi:hypothetical protein